MTKKTETSIHRANGGNHSPVNYRKHKHMLLTHPYANGRLYHIVLTGSEDRKVYRKAVELLCKQLRAKGMPCRYKACYELDKFKRFHKHVFLLIEAKDSNPDSIIHFSPTGWFTKMLKGMGLGFNICSPEDVMHYVGGKKVNYAYVPKKAGSKLEDCCEWISYLTKVRSKAGVEGQIYTGSTNREPKPSLLTAAPQAAEEIVVTDDKGNELTPADKFIAGKYEKAVGKNLDVEAIRLFLLAEGIKRTPAQVINDLDVRFSFHGYAQSHPAPAKLTYAEIDAQLGRDERTTSRTDRVLPLPPYRLPMGRGNTYRQGTT